MGGQRLSNILWCVGIIIGTVLLKRPLSRLVAYLLSTVAKQFSDKRHANTFQSLIRRPVELLLSTVLFYIAINQLTVLLNTYVLQRMEAKKTAWGVRLSDVADHIFLFLAIWFSVLILSRVVDFIYLIQQDRAHEAHNRERQQLLPLVRDVVKLVLWCIGIFWVLGTVFHVNIPALITGLGIGGVAIALAAKESVENLFAAFTILTDKPFQSGDTVKLGTLEGQVERIGFRSTRLRSVDGSVVIIPNKKLVNENLENLTQRDTRRVKLTVNMPYGLEHGALQTLIAELETMLEATTPVTDVDIMVDGFAENVFQLIVTYHLPHPLPEGPALNDIRREVNLRIYDIVNKQAGFGKGGAAKPFVKAADEDNADSEGNSDNSIL